ncbi:hypothetical protein RFY98_09330, partial [Acinetobacter baumannii]|nr:hypothetical protein [Acinetobacter baumannii]
VDNGKYANQDGLYWEVTVPKGHYFAMGDNRDQRVLVWRDSFSCILNDKHPAVTHLNLKSYLDAQHIWVSKT